MGQGGQAIILQADNILDAFDKNQSKAQIQRDTQLDNQSHGSLIHLFSFSEQDIHCPNVSAIGMNSIISTLKSDDFARYFQLE